MMTWAEKRLTVNQIKTHPFFFGADWNALRHIEPPFVPHLQSTVDTSYFPTEEFGNVAEQMEQVEGISREKDIAFLKWVPPCSVFSQKLTVLFSYTFRRLDGPQGR
jgi:hypothetical protein